MTSNSCLDLSSRERQIMEALFRRGRRTVSEIRQDLADPPVTAAIRTMLSRLETKGYIDHVQEGPRTVYFAKAPVERARAVAMQRMMRTFFDSSPTKTVAAILDEAHDSIAPEELDQLAELIEHARKQGK